VSAAAASSADEFLSALNDVGAAEYHDRHPFQHRMNNGLRKTAGGKRVPSPAVRRTSIRKPKGLWRHHQPRPGLPAKQRGWTPR
jgi:hypothetical protein